MNPLSHTIGGDDDVPVHHRHPNQRNRHLLHVIEDPVDNMITDTVDTEMAQFLNELPWKEEAETSGMDDKSKVNGVHDVINSDVSDLDSELDSLLEMVDTDGDIPMVPSSPYETTSGVQVHPNYRRQDPYSQGTNIGVEPINIHLDPAPSNEQSISMMDVDPLHDLTSQTACDCVIMGAHRVSLDNSVKEDFVKPQITPSGYSFMENAKVNVVSPVPTKVVNPQTMMDRLRQLMKKSAETQSALQDWDSKNGLPKSHSPTMVNSSRSRKQLQEGIILRKWNAAPLIDVGGKDQ